MNGMDDIGAETTTLLTQRAATEAPREMRSEETDGKPDASTMALVKETIDKIKKWEKHHRSDFERMQADVKFARNKHGEQWGGTKAAPRDEYVAQITHRHIQSRTGVLYAKNPRVKARRKKRLDFKVWDGTQAMLQQAMMAMQEAAAMDAQAQAAAAATGLPPAPPNDGIDTGFAQMVIQEAVQVKERRALLDKVGMTAEIMYHYYQGEGNPDFKSRAKSWVRRTLTTGVGWVKLDFQRERGYRTPLAAGEIADLNTELGRLKSELDKIAEGETYEGSPRIAEIQAMLAKLETEQSVILKEGLAFGFPKSWNVIPDDRCSQLTGLVGCWELAERIPMTPDEVRENYSVDVSKSYTKFQGTDKTGKTRDEAVVYEYYNKRTGLMAVVCDGYCDWIVPPGPPRVKTERFFPFYALCFNETECEDGEIYPPSDVELIKPMQREYNRSREALRQHRIASQPGHVGNKNAFSNENDVKKMANRTVHEVVLLEGLPPDAKISDVLTSIPLNPIDPNIYMVEHVFTDVQRATGDQAANLGGTGGDTATESSIAENSRLSSLASNIDDLDMILTEIARDGCQIMLNEVSQETAAKIAGVGAVWPSVAGDEMASEVYLEIVAGSSGRPNRDRDAANFERLMPYLMQLPGLQPEPIVKHGVQLLDETMDVEDVYMAGLPSILTMNAMAKNAGNPMGGDTPTGDPKTDPNQQGGAQQGGPPAGGGGAGDAYPAPAQNGPPALP
jgi:hypothetical protein